MAISLMIPVLILFLGGDLTETGRNDYTLAGVSPYLLKDADAVVRSDERTFEYNRPGRGTLYVNKAITILNSDGLHHAEIRIPYHNFTNVRRIRGAIYDSNGDRVRRIRGRDVEDVARFSDYSMIDDSRIKKLDMIHSSFPYTIEIEYRIEYSGFIMLPAWLPVTHEKMSVERAVYRVLMPEGELLAFKMYNIPEPNPRIFATAGVREYLWEITELEAIEREYLGPPWHELLPAVTLRTDEFRMERYPGSLQSWNDFGI